MDSKFRDAIYQETADLLVNKYGEQMKISGSGCLYWMDIGMAVIRARTGLVPCPQAGSCSWPILAVDDGVSPTHFSFMWNTPKDKGIVGTAPISVGSIALPEMHCWIGIPATGDIIDFSTGYIPEIAKNCGFKWNAPLPPQYLWTKARRIPKGVYYEPNREATLLACRYLC